MSIPKSQAASVERIISKANNIVIIQADNPDGDSLASSLALEQILGDMGKEPFMYCGVDIPSYLQYLEGWDRVSKELPRKFDASIIVDTSSESLLGQLSTTGQLAAVRTKPVVVLDHHQVDQEISFANASLNVEAVSTGEIIYELSSQLKWPLNHKAMSMIVTSIMADSRGLTTDKTTARSIHIIAELVDGGVSIPELETARRQTMRRPTEIIHYKGRLLQRIEYFNNDQISIVTIPWNEIEKYSHAYNPTMLVMEDMLLTEQTKLAIGFKTYPDGKVTAKIRANFGSPIAGKLAEAFGGGGHPYASGFKVIGNKTFDKIKSECIELATKLLSEQEQSQE